jgi:nitrile hydratase accessory protein
LLFAAPWESQIFGVTMALFDTGLFEWSEFQASLITTVKRWEDGHVEGQYYQYYERWYEALEGLLDTKGVVGSDAVAERATIFAQRTVGHDHDHHNHLHDYD